MLRFTDEHEWLKREGDVATVGITAHAAEQLGDLVFIELPKVGAVLKKGQAAAVVESVKAASDLYAPVGGVVTAVNDAAVDSTELLNQHPYEGGWLIKLRLTPGVGALMSAEAYEKYVDEIKH